MIALLFALLSTAHADEAERLRLQSELQSLVAKGTWSGVERTYRELVALQVPLANPDHLAGFQAAQQVGDQLLALQRLQRVSEPPEGPDEAWEEARRTLEVLRTQYRPVHVIREGAQGGAVVLERAQMPFAPDQRTAIERARARLTTDGELTALLPAGEYTFDGAPVTIEAGTTWQVIVAP